jgi:hypothetical protein
MKLVIIARNSGLTRVKVEFEALGIFYTKAPKRVYRFVCYSRSDILDFHDIEHIKMAVWSELRCNFRGLHSFGADLSIVVIARKF